MSETHWTEEERAVLIELAKSGVPASQAARQLNRSRNSILGFAFRQFGGYTKMIPEELKALHLSRVKVNKERREAKQKARKDGLSASGRSTKTLPPEVVAEVIKAPVPAPETDPVRMSNIGRFQCRYIVSDERKDPNPLMCGAPVKGSTSWCPHHYQIVFSPVPPRKSPRPS